MKKYRANYRYPYYLLGAYLVCVLISMAAANYPLNFFGFVVPGGVFIFPFAFMINDITAEIYGYVYPRLWIWIGIVGGAVFSLYLIFICALQPAAYFCDQKAYQIVFDPTIRVFFASVIGLFTGEFVNIFLLTKWKVKWSGRFFIFRAIGSTAVGQFFVSLTIDIIAFLGLTHGIANLVSMIVIGFLIKMLFAIIGVFPSWILVNYLKKKDNVDHFDFNTDFNPFSLKLR